MSNGLARPMISVASCVALLLFSGLEASGQVTQTAAGSAMIDCSGTAILTEIAGNNMLRERLLRQLSASSSWRVAVERGILVAQRRIAHVDATAPTDDADANAGVDVRIFLDGYRMNVGPDRVVQVKAGARTAAMPLFLMEDILPGAVASTLGVIAGGSSEMAIEIGELSKDRSRRLTIEALRQVVAELELFKKNSDEVEKAGYVKAITPADSVIESDGPGTLFVKDGFQKGIYEISGYVNPGEPGYITIEVILNKTGEAIDPKATAVQTLQYVGWSKDPRLKFQFGTTLTMGWVPGSDGKDMAVSFRVVFHPSNTHVLLEKQQNASSWER